MKIYNFALIFLIFFLSAIIKTDMQTGKLIEIKNEKEELENSLVTAVSDAVAYLAETGSYGSGTINKDEILAAFFASLYSSMGIISDKSAQSEVEIYIPVILFCDTDGFYVYYYDEYVTYDGLTYIDRVWSEKMPYSYEDEYFIYRFTLTDLVYIYDKHDMLKLEDKFLYVDYKEFVNESSYEDLRLKYKDCILFNESDFNTVKKASIINKLEDVLAYYTSRHNHIASKNGITYSFSFPYGRRDEWADFINDVSLLVVFQGYPYGPERDYRYNKIISSGANVIKKYRYFVEEKSWYKLAHKEGCKKIKDTDMLLEETFDSLEECVKLGAFCCECIEHGARVPDLR